MLAVAGLGFAFTRGGDDAPESREAGHVQAGVEPTPSASESKLQEAVVAELEVDRRGKPSPLDPPPLPTDAASWRAALSHRNPYVVREALRLRGPWVSESIEAFTAATSGPRDEDTLEVVLALRELDPSAYLPALERGLEDPERADPVRALLTALGERAAPLAQKLQAYLVEGASAEEQLELAHLVADLGGPGAREALERLEQEAGKDRYARMAGKAALERLAAPEELPSDLAGLGAALARGVSGTRLAWRALDALGARELSRADVQTLTQTLGDASLAVLGVVLAKPAHVTQLRELLADPRPEAQRLAAQALSRLGPAAQDTVAPLRALLTSEHDAVRMDAAAALGAIGPAAAAARSDLEPLLEAEDVGGMFNVNVDEPAARFALGRLGGS
ncbi:MAG: HEAT repeat domain-containing protein [Planctomycetota bacterium]